VCQSQPNERPLNESREHHIKQLAVGKIRLHLHVTVFGLSAFIIILVLFLTLLNIHSAEQFFAAIRLWATHTFGWLLIMIVQAFLLYCVYLALSRFGSIRIGGSDAKPAYSLPTWFAMLFSAGMGIGLLFYGVAEPVIHFNNPPGMEGGTRAAAMRAMDLTFLHWGVHAWAIYALVGLSLAYFSYNHKLPLTIRSAFYPLFGPRIYGPIGHVIDIIAVVATLFGVATSLGFGAVQINTGLNFLFGLPVSGKVQILLITVITIVATLSVVSGIDRGIRRLSEINLIFALLLLVFLLLVGPTLFLLNSTVQNTGHYLQNLLILGSWTQTYRMESDWQSNWTLFYWTWWIAWSPFVGMFIARISKGRTVRQFLAGTLLVPALLCIIWFSVLGGAAIYAEMYDGMNIAAAVNENISTALFKLLEFYPVSTLTSALAVVLVFVFFVTSSDSGSLVIDIITAGGNLNPPLAQRVFWAVTEGVVAAVLLAGGGLLALQTAAIMTGLPFALVLVLMCFGLYRSFNREVPARRH
jgi:choline/glycine/proline betaine transport protein